MEPQVLKVYFFILVFATIISRIVEYVKIIFQWLWPKIKLLRYIGDSLWNAVRVNLDNLNLEYDPLKMREAVNQVSVALVLQLLAFVLGVLLCLVFKLEVVSALNLQLENETLKQILTGLLAGAGIAPIHSVFRMSGEKRKIKELKTTVTGR